MKISLADSKDISQLSILFDQYRVFYGQSSDVERATAFIKERLKNRDSVIIAAIDNEQMAGFTQLYPSFSSVSMKPIWILNDLFVVESYRRKNVAKQLMETAKEHASKTRAIRLSLATQYSNNPAQKLYEAMGYKKDETFYHYNLSI
jgi:ribosomal protein S18 acetylase RimI-like enzyme